MADIETQPLGKPERNKHVDLQSLLMSLLGMLDDNKFVKEMLDTHARGEGDIDAHSIFVLAENTLKGATKIVDGVVNPEGTVSASGVDYKPVKDGFNPPTEAISELTCQLTCKALDTKNVRETMVSLFHELSHYSWVDKAVVTLSCLAIYYADFWRLAEVEPSDKLGESVAILKGLPAITKLVDTKKIQVLGTLNGVIKSILDMTRCVVEFEKESKDVPELSADIDVSTRATQIIIFILACSIQFTTLISVVDESKGKDLSAFTSKVNMIDHTIKSEFERFMQRKDEIREYQRLKGIFIAPTDIGELIKAIFYKKDDLLLYLGSTKTMHKIDSLRGKHVLLLISDLKLSSYDRSIMENIYNETKFKESQYDILWVPIVDQDQEIISDDMLKQFKTLQSEMTWYSAHHPTLINKVAIRIIKELWHFRQEAIVVKLNPQGKFECRNAMHMIRMWGFHAFPFTDSVAITIWSRPDISWFELIVNKTVIPNIQEMIKSEKLIFLYASDNTKHVQDLEERIKMMSDDSGTPICVFDVTKIPTFWEMLDSCIFTTAQAQIPVLDPPRQEILRLYSNFKTGGGFALLAKGSRVVSHCPLMLAYMVVSQYDAWKDKVNVVNGKTLEMAFKEHLDSLVTPDACFHFYIPNTVGYMLEDPSCPVCRRTMRSSVKFECCHGAH